MKKLVLIILVAGLVGLLGLRIYEETAPDPAAQGFGPAAPAGGRGRGGAAAPLLVSTATLEPHVFNSGREFVGELVPLREVDVVPQVSGYLESITVEEADPVREGQLLATVDDAQIEQQIRRQEAALAVARAGAVREQATLENLRVQVERNRSLHEEGLVSLETVEDIESRYRVGEAQLQLALSQVDQAEAALEELRIQQALGRVVSPMDGIVAERHLDPGALAGQSTAVLTLIDLIRLKTVVAVPEVAIADIRVGVEAEITVDAVPGRVYRGQVVRISPRVNPETRSVDVEIQIDNPEQILRPGMFARVRLAGAAAQPAPSIPRSALLTRGTSQGVFLLEPGNVVRFREIAMGRNEGGWVEVLDGLNPGETFVTDGAQSLNDGDRVRVAGAEPEGGASSSVDAELRPTHEAGRPGGTPLTEAAERRTGE